MRQKDDVSQAGQESADNSADAEQSSSDLADVPGLLDPLLDQIMQARDASGVSGEADDRFKTAEIDPESDEAAVNNLLAMIQGSATQMA